MNYFRSHLKNIFIIVLLLFVFVGVFDVKAEAKVTYKTTYSYYNNKKVKDKCNWSYDGNIAISYSCYRYNTSGRLTNLYQRYYAKNKKPLRDYSYTYRNNKAYLSSATYYYNTHTNKKTPLGYKYATNYYNSNGKYLSTTYFTKAGKQAEVVRVAKQQNGKRYRSGGNTPKGFDCSGLTSYVYKQAIKKNIGRASYNQTKNGYYVALNTKSLQPGDILFWGSKANPYHVGIYIGNGKYIHASTPQTGVQIKNLNSFKPSYAKRMI
jgi:cell wall-associated NlpC family hydrolase